MLTTSEYEDGAVNDLGRAIERLAPRGMEYEHHLRWGDDNGHSHVRAALLGPSLSVPFVGGRLTLGTWQQNILIDFDGYRESWPVGADKSPIVVKQHCSQSRLIEDCLDGKVSYRERQGCRLSAGSDRA